MGDDEPDDNLSRQKDEIEALHSIYGNDFVIEDEFCPTISVLIRMSELERDDVNLVVSFNSNYPSQAPPVFHLSVPWLRRDKKQELVNALNETYLQNMGESIVYIWVEKLRELLGNIWITLDAKEVTSNSQTSGQAQDTNFAPVSPNAVLPTIFTGEPLMDRKSTFQAHVARITHAQQVPLVLDELRKTKKIATATHNMFAFRIVNEETKAVQQDYDDDGETHAGGRLMHLLGILNCSNVLVVVTRWYGGIMLYGDRFKHINNVARQLLEKEGFIPQATSNTTVSKK